MPVLRALGYVEIVVCLTGLCFLVIKRQWGEYWALGSLLAVRAACDIAFFVIIGDHGRRFSLHGEYKVYFYMYWLGYAIEAVLGLFVIFGVFRGTMAPLKGLRRVGTAALRWVAAIFMILAVGSAFAPTRSSMRFIINAVSQMQRTESFLALCLLALVVFAVLRMGLSARGMVFGASLGLGVLAVENLGMSMWSVHGRGVFYNVVNGLAVCAALTLWTVYLALPEPTRGEMALPANSWLRRWDRVCLGWKRIDGM